MWHYGCDYIARFRTALAVAALLCCCGASSSSDWEPTEGCSVENLENMIKAERLNESLSHFALLGMLGCRVFVLDSVQVNISKFHFSSLRDDIREDGEVCLGERPFLHAVRSVFPNDSTPYVGVSVSTRNRGYYRVYQGWRKLRSGVYVIDVTSEERREVVPLAKLPSWRIRDFTSNPYTGRLRILFQVEDDNGTLGPLMDTRYEVGSRVYGVPESVGVNGNFLGVAYDVDAKAFGINWNYTTQVYQDVYDERELFYNLRSRTSITFHYPQLIGNYAAFSFSAGFFLIKRPSGENSFTYSATSLHAPSRKACVSPAMADNFYLQPFVKVAPSLQRGTDVYEYIAHRLYSPAKSPPRWLVEESFEERAISYAIAAAIMLGPLVVAFIAHAVFQIIDRSG